MSIFDFSRFIPRFPQSPIMDSPMPNVGVNPNAFTDVPPDISTMNMGGAPMNIDVLRSLYSPEHEDIDRMHTMLDQFPVHQAPGKLGKIGAMLAGISQGPKAASDYMEMPY